MPSEEGKQVLQLLAEGKIDVEQAYRLLRALGDVEEATPRAPRAPFSPTPPNPPIQPGPQGARGRILRIRVTEDGEQKVNVAIPLAIARIGKMKLASSGLVRGHLGKFGIDLDELLRSVDFPGKIVDIADDEDRVEIFVE
ncbi:MAG: hypothetical protein E6J15_02365 [Chloroflexi bacterium]|nr:MAG: hypothetical protein E6J15_02365 [Chloroflexota bacterium]